MRVARLVPVALGLAVALTACGHPGGGTASIIADNGSSLMASQRVTPEDALAKAAKKAQQWQGDARLVALAWGIAKTELASVVFHLFQSPKADKLYLVQTKLTSFWQDGTEVTEPVFTKPARYLDTLVPGAVSGERALDIAKAFLPAGDKPLAGLIEAKPAKFLPPVWGVYADGEKVLIDADSGKVLLHADNNRQLPALPFNFKP